MTHTASPGVWSHGGNEGFVREYIFPCQANHVQVNRGAHFTLGWRRFMKGSQGFKHQVFGCVLQKVESMFRLEAAVVQKSEIGVCSVMCKGSGGPDVFMSYTLKWDWFPWKVQGQRKGFVWSRSEGVQISKATRVFFQRTYLLL